MEPPIPLFLVILDWLAKNQCYVRNHPGNIIDIHPDLYGSTGEFPKTCALQEISTGPSFVPLLPRLGPLRDKLLIGNNLQLIHTFLSESIV